MTLISPDFFKKMLRWGLCAWALCQPVSIAGANIAMGVMIAAIIGAAAASRSLPSLRSPLEKPLWIYLGVAILASLLGTDPRHSFGRIHAGVYEDCHKVLVFYLFLAAFALDASTAFLAFWAAGFAVSMFFGFAQVFGWYGPGFIQSAMAHLASMRHFWIWLAPSPRAHGTINAVPYGEIAGMALLGGLCYRAFRKKGGLGRKFSALFCFAAGAALILSLTRGAWLGVAAALLLMAAFKETRRLIPPTAPILSAVALAFFLCALSARVWPSPFNPFVRLLESFSLGATSTPVRLAAWHVAWRMFLDHPLLGVGVSNYAALFGRYHAFPFFGAYSWSDPHDLYLCHLAERGLAGLAALLFLFGAMFARAWRLYRKNPGFANAWLLLWLAAFFAMNLTESAFQTAMIWMPTLALYCWAEQASRNRPSN